MTSFDLNYLLQDLHIQAYSEAGEFRKATCDFGGSRARAEQGTGGRNSTHNDSVSLAVPSLILERMLFLHKEFSQPLFFFN